MIGKYLSSNNEMCYSTKTQSAHNVLHIPTSDTYLELLHVPPSVCIFLGLHLLHIYISMVDLLSP